MNRELIKIRNQRIKELSDKGIDAKTLAIRFDMTRRAVYYILAKFDERKEGHERI